MTETIIIGGGAAGFMAAITAAESFPDTKVTILEKNRTVLNKVRVSGGGRCNVTNAVASIADLCNGYPRGAKFLRPLFQKFNNHDTMKWFEDRGVRLKAEPDGRIFPKSDDSQTIIDCLQNEAYRLKINVETSVGVNKIEIVENGFELKLLNGSCILADKVIVASGGHPQQTGYEWLTKLGIKTEAPVPSLFTFNVPNSTFHELSGVAVPNTKIKIAGTKLEDRGPMLFTHWGLSGPVVLRTSAWGAREMNQKKYEFTVLANFSNFVSNEAARVALSNFRTDIQWRQKLVHAHSVDGIPSRLWKMLVQLAEIPAETRWADLPAKNLNRLAENLTNFLFSVKDKTTFKEEFVTCGGVSLSEINPETMESKKVKGLFFAGEILDIDGITGGYNFQSAWTTGYIAGKNVL